MNEIRDEIFALSYTVPGFTYPIEEMDADDRGWYLNRVIKQKKAEQKAMEGKK